MDQTRNTPSRRSCAAAPAIDRAPPSGTAPRTSVTREIVPLTALRGVAALLVVWFHYSGGVLPNLRPDDYTELVSKSYLCVDLFFMLSGFVLVHVYKRSLGERPSWTGIRGFFLARFARIYPAYFAVLLALIGLQTFKWLIAARLPGPHTSGFSGHFSPGSLLLNLLMLQSFPIEHELTWDGPTWSVSAEWYTYLLLPLLLPPLVRIGERTRGLLVLLSLAAVGAMSWYHGSLNMTWQWGFLRCLPEFIAGAGLYGVYEALQSSHWIVPDPLAFTWLALVLALMHFGADDALIVTAMSLLLVMLACNSGRAARLFSGRGIRYLGRISYSLYLVHMPLLDLYMLLWRLFNGQRLYRAGFSTGQSLLVLLGETGIALLCAAALNHWLEEPARRWIRGMRQS